MNLQTFMMELTIGMHHLRYWEVLHLIGPKTRQVHNHGVYMDYAAGHFRLGNLVEFHKWAEVMDYWSPEEMALLEAKATLELMG